MPKMAMSRHEPMSSIWTKSESKTLFQQINLELNIFVYSSGENCFKNATLKRLRRISRSSTVFDGLK